MAKWCPGEDSNLHGFHHWYLKPARLPIPPPGLAGTHKYPVFALATRRTRPAARRWLPICDAKLASGCPVQARNDPVFGATPIFKARRPRTRRGTAVHHVDMLVTVFGGSGFLGRHVVRALAKSHYRIRAAVRRPELAGPLQPPGRLGPIHAVPAHLRPPASAQA